jgi:hypothetical protein
VDVVSSHLSVGAKLLFCPTVRLRVLTTTPVHTCTHTFAYRTHTRIWQFVFYGPSSYLVFIPNPIIPASRTMRQSSCAPIQLSTLAVTVFAVDMRVMRKTVIDKRETIDDTMGDTTRRSRKPDAMSSSTDATRPDRVSRG